MEAFTLRVNMNLDPGTHILTPKPDTLHQKPFLEGQSLVVE